MNKHPHEEELLRLLENVIDSDPRRAYMLTRISQLVFQLVDKRTQTGRQTVLELITEATTGSSAKSLYTTPEDYPH